VDNNYLDLGMNKSGFVHTLPSGRLRFSLMISKSYVLSSDKLDTEVQFDDKQELCF
jgi:hypothetical protein